MRSDAESMLLKKHYDALKHLKEANAKAEMLLRDHPDAYDAYVAPGIAFYVIGSLPSSARFLLWFGGIHGDKQLGMSQVKQDALARKNLKELTEEFPGNAVYDTEYAKALGHLIPATIGPAS